MNKYTFFFVFALFISNISAQNEEIFVDVNSYLSSSTNTEDPSSTGLMPIKAAVNSSISGSAYLFDNWTNLGFIYLKDGKVLKLNTMNYNAQADRFEVKISADSSFAFAPQSMDSVVINNKKFKHFTGSGFAGYAEILSETQNPLFIKKYNVKIEKAKQNPITGGFDFPDKVIVEETFLIKNDFGFIPISLNKKSILKQFSSYDNEINKFVKANKLSFKKESDVASIIKFVSELSEKK